jgi:tripartite-type tricarboxylate transporter receptor subunit TctC
MLRLAGKSCGLSVVRAAVVALFGLSLIGTARAEYPDRAVTIIVSFAAGGGSDIAARLISEPLTRALGKPVVVENRTGAGGNIGIAAAARAPHDGYTLLVTSSAFVVNPSLYAKVPYEPLKDFEPLVLFGASPNIIAVRTASPIKSLPDFIAKAKENPGKMNWTSPGAGTTPYLVGEVLKLRTGIDMQHIPFPGAGPAVQAGLAGQVDIMTANLGSVAQLVESGMMRVLAVTAKERSADLPDVPTLDELGIKDAESNTFQAIYAPAGTPRPVTDRLVKEIIAMLQDPDLRERFKKSGLPVLAEGPEVFRARIIRELAMYKEIVDQAGLVIK